MEEENKSIEELVFVPKDPKEELAGYVTEKFKSAEDSRLYDEQRWLNSYRQYRGLYSTDTQFTETEKSQVFIKITKTKVLAAYGQIIDVLFAGQRFPLGVEATRIPKGVDEAVHFDPKEPENALDELNNVYGFPGDGKDIPRGATQESLQQLNLGAHEDDLADITDKLKQGPGLTPTAQTYYPAQKAAKRMEKTILDQLEESNASKHLRTVAFEMALFGTGILKGPFAFDKEKANWDEEGNYNPESETVPRVESVSILNFYPYYDANNMSEAEYIIERHKLSHSELRNLKNRP